MRISKSSYLFDHMSNNWIYYLPFVFRVSENPVNLYANRDSTLQGYLTCPSNINVCYISHQSEKKKAILGSLRMSAEVQTESQET